MKQSLSDKTIFVTGGTGFIGSHLIETLIKNHCKVITTNFFSKNPRSYFFSQNLDKKVRLVDLDLAKFVDLFRLVSSIEIDYIIHLAAQSMVEPAYINPLQTFSVNISGTANVLESARLSKNIKGIIIASSDKAYGKSAKKDYQENDSLAGDHPYEVSKAAADLLATSYVKTYGLPVVITRFGNVYGEGDLHFSRLIPGIMKSLVNKETFGVRSDGTFTRDYVYVKDVVNGYITLLNNLEKAFGQSYNFGSEETLSVKQVINLVQKVLNKKMVFKIENNQQNEIPHQSLDFTKIKKQFGWQPKYKMSRTLKSIFSWYRKNLA